MLVSNRAEIRDRSPHEIARDLATVCTTASASATEFLKILDAMADPFTELSSSQGWCMFQGLSINFHEDIFRFPSDLLAVAEVVRQHPRPWNDGDDAPCIYKAMINLTSLEPAFRWVVTEVNLDDTHPTPPGEQPPNGDNDHDAEEVERYQSVLPDIFDSFKWTFELIVLVDIAEVSATGNNAPTTTERPLGHVPWNKLQYISYNHLTWDETSEKSNIGDMMMRRGASRSTADRCQSLHDEWADMPVGWPMPQASLSFAFISER